MRFSVFLRGKKIPILSPASHASVRPCIAWKKSTHGLRRTAKRKELISSITHSPVKHLHSLPVLLNKPPQAWADLRGDALHPDIYGIVLFHQTPDGVIIATDVSGLPHGQGTCSGRFFAFHIHEGSACRGSATDPFSAAGGHFNPAGCSHPYHAGDLPPLLGCGGDAMTVFLTDRFRLDEVIGRTVVIHENADDFTTQPAGNAGARIACGVIERFTISQQPQF